MQSQADAAEKQIQLDGTTVEDVRRAEESSVRWKRNGDGRIAPEGRTLYFLFQPSLPLIQATVVRGAAVFQHWRVPLICNLAAIPSNRCCYYS